MSFDRLAPHYDRMEAVLAGGKLQRMRTRWLTEIPAPRRALLAGEGHGRFLEALRRKYPAAEIVCADSSDGMLDIARRRLGRCGLSDGVHFVHTDLRNPVAIGDGFDLLATHFFLDCFPPGQLSGVIAGLAGTAGPNANWLIADFARPERGLARLRAGLILKSMYLFFRFATRLPARSLVSPDPLLRRHGFRLRDRQTAEWGLLRSDWWCCKADDV